MNAGTERPFVSVVVPVWNEVRHIDACLRRLFEQTYPADRVEVIVVDGLSDDGTRECVTALIADRSRDGLAAGPAVRLVDDPKRQRPSAVNAGIRAARGDVIARIDARALVPRDYLARCVDALVRTGADNVGGIQKPIATEPMQEAIGLAMSHPFGVGNAQFRLGRRSGFVDSIYLGCFRREIFDRVGLFDEDAPLLSEDSDINQRIRESGGRVYLDTDIVGGYYPRETLGALWKLYFRYGGARAGNLLKHGNLTSWRQAVPPALVAALVVLGALSIVSRWSLGALGVLVGAYVVGDLIAARGGVRGRRTPVAVAARRGGVSCLHVAWGSGVLVRLWRRRGAESLWSWTER